MQAASPDCCSMPRPAVQLLAQAAAVSCREVLGLQHLGMLCAMYGICAAEQSKQSTPAPAAAAWLLTGLQ